MTSVKYFHSGMPGAPTLSGTAGHMINVLDGCLVNGFGKAGATDTLDSLVVSSDVATATIAAGHPFEADTIALIAGATPSGLNGEKRIISVTATTFTFATSGISNQTATGTITSKLAPAGWVKQYSTTNIAAYKSGNVVATGCLLRIDDTGTTNARVIGYESMVGINDTLVGPFPTTVQFSGGLYWPKSNTASTAARNWIIFADDRAFYIFVAYNVSGYSTTYGGWFFGDFISKKSPDPWACLLSGRTDSSTIGVPANDLEDISFADPDSDATAYVTRGVSGLGGSTVTRRIAISSLAGQGSTQYSSGHIVAARITYPNPADNGLYLSQMMVFDSLSFRGTYPGALYAPQSIGTLVFSSKDSVTGIEGYSGRTLKTVLNANGPLFVDITGPWR